jgi:hypothetical protein
VGCGVVTKYESSYSVTVTIDDPSGDTTVYCYDSLRYDFSPINDTTYLWGADNIIITFTLDTLVFKRVVTGGGHPGTTTYYFAKESRPVPYCSRGCVPRNFP